LDCPEYIGPFGTKTITMSNNLYTAYWQSLVPSIIQQFKEGNSIFQLEIEGIKQFGDRQSYYANFRIINGKLDSPKAAHAPGRDFYAVLVEDDYFIENLASTTIQVTITKNLQLKMEILATNAPDFFTEEDFEELNKFPKQIKDKNNTEHQKTYDFLKTTYSKVAYWARQVQAKVFPEGGVHAVQKPTNQANRFEEYQWAKIYPDQNSRNEGVLAFTVGVNTDNEFAIKIDTVGLGEGDERKKKYLMYRGDYYNSSIVKITPANQILDKGWEHLINLTANIVIDLRPQFDVLYKELTNMATETAKKEENKEISTYPLNTILYGPPGTGKTYHTIDKALQIIDPSFYEKHKGNRSTLTEKFKTLLITDWKNPSGQIAFVTFHQSMSYEDFIEGIKPVRPETSGTIHYEIVDGIFKKLCTEANRKSRFSVTVDGQPRELTKELFEQFYYSYSATLPDQKEPTSPVKLLTKEKSAFELFQNGAESIVVKAGVKRAPMSLAFSELSAVLFNEKEPTYKSYEEIVIKEILKEKQFTNLQQDSSQKKFVLIIDEINRGNISQIFGELITLIEDSKRQGKKEELTIILPYSKRAFSVPANLYLVGTMNTADRSVEALDSALRRRFVFEEMPPKPELLNSYQRIKDLWVNHKDRYSVDQEWIDEEKAFCEFHGMTFTDKEGYKNLMPSAEKLDEELAAIIADDFRPVVTFDGLNLEKLLTTINGRLFALLTKDHTIGHAWLMDVYSLQDLQAAFKNKILPLLQEYFYNHYAKIGFVLGKAFIDEKASRGVFAKDFNGADDLKSDYEERVEYILKDPFTLSLQAFTDIYK